MNRKGFTLIEIMLAIVILVIGLFALASAMTTVTRMVTWSANRSKATAFTEQIYERQISRGCSVRTNGQEFLTVGSNFLASVRWEWSDFPGTDVLNKNAHKLLLTTTVRLAGNRVRTNTTETEIHCLI